MRARRAAATLPACGGWQGWPPAPCGQEVRGRVRRYRAPSSPLVQCVPTDVVGRPEPAACGADVREDLVQQPPAAFVLGFRCRSRRAASVGTILNQTFEETPHERRHGGVEFGSANAGPSMRILVHRHRDVSHGHSLTVSAYRSTVVAASRRPRQDGAEVAPLGTCQRSIGQKVSRASPGGRAVPGGQTGCGGSARRGRRTLEL